MRKDKRRNKALKVLNNYYGTALVSYYLAGIFTLDDINTMYRYDKVHKLFKYI